jgi:hypothetical protein
MENMIYKVGYVKDVLNNNYLGLKFNYGQIQPFMKELYEIVADNEKFETLIANQQKRDKKEGHSHHATVVNVMEFNQLVEKLGSSFQERLDAIFSLDISDLEFKGVGKAEKNGNVAYFVVLESPTLDEVRSSLGLEPKDFHITIGFDKKDVFGVRKNKVLEYDTKVQRLYKLNMERYGSHTWIHNVDNFDEELKNVPEDKIELLGVSDTKIEYNVGDTRITIALIDDKLRVVTKSPIK